ncbi:MAG: hypothetical protein HYU65_02060 [Armatimonadetes bacterium]|nr:hypothetical protein [Armatimonadota bacterium]
MAASEEEKYRKLLIQYLRDLGRDDIDVGHVEELDQSRLRVEFIKGSIHHEAELPVSGLEDPEQARMALNVALLRLSKAVEKRHIEAAKQD